MNWFLILAAFSLAVLMGASAASLLARIRPQWSDRRRLFVSAAVLPVLTAMAFLAAMVAVASAGPSEGADVGDALEATATLGGLFALLAFAGALVGAWLRQRGPRR